MKNKMVAKMKDLFNKIRLWWKHEARYYHTDFIKGIKNLIKWTPTIWKTREWDHMYLLDILQTKLKHMVQYWERHDIIRHENMEGDIRYMKICIKLIDIIRKDKYEMDAFDAIEKKWGESQIRWEKINELDEDGEALYEMHSDRPNVNTEQEKQEYNKEYNAVMEVARAKHQKAIKLLFNILYTRLEYWWI